MARKKKDAPVVLPAHPGSFPAPEVKEPAPVDLAALVARVDELGGNLYELEGDLTRVVDLLVKGDLDAAKFREILSKRQGKIKAADSVV